MVPVKQVFAEPELICEAFSAWPRSPSKTSRGMKGSTSTAIFGNRPSTSPVTSATRCSSSPHLGGRLQVQVVDKASFQQTQLHLSRTRLYPARKSSSSSIRDEVFSLPFEEEESREPGFHLELQRVERAVDEVRRRQLSTRGSLEACRNERGERANSGLLGDTDALKFNADLAAVHREVNESISVFMKELGTLQAVNYELQDISNEVTSLTETDKRMASVLQRISSKLDSFENTLGCRSKSH